jgi:hypothetical protein
MNGAYGSIMQAFPEQLITVTYFAMDPKHGSGWETRTQVRQIQGVLQCTGGRKVKESNGNLVTARTLNFWSEEELEAGRFIDDGSSVYRIASDNEWIREVGYTVYGLERVVAADGTETLDPDFSEGSFA